MVVASLFDKHPVGFALVCALGAFWSARGHWSEALRWIERTLTQTAHAPLNERRAQALYIAARIYESRGDYTQARALYEESLRQLALIHL